MEIGKLKNSIANAEVTSEIDGVVKSVNSIENPEVNSMTGEAEPFMTVLATVPPPLMETAMPRPLPTMGRTYSVSAPAH